MPLRASQAEAAQSQPGSHSTQSKCGCRPKPPDSSGAHSTAFPIQSKSKAGALCAKVRGVIVESGLLRVPGRPICTTLLGLLDRYGRDAFTVADRISYQRAVVPVIQLRSGPVQCAGCRVRIDGSSESSQSTEQLSPSHLPSASLCHLCSLRYC